MENDTNDRLVQFKLLLPARIKDTLADAAHANRRSLSQEIVARLELTLVPLADQEMSEAVELAIEQVADKLIAFVRQKVAAEGDDFNDDDFREITKNQEED